MHGNLSIQIEIKQQFLSKWQSKITNGTLKTENGHFIKQPDILDCNKNNNVF